MKRLIPLFFSFFCYFLSTAQENFITVWNMNNSGTADNEISFNITTAPGLSVGYSWSCSDGSTGNGIIPEDSTIATISGLPQGQIITLSIEPEHLKTFTINNIPDRMRLTDILQWGSVSWLSMKDAFNGARNLNISATDIPDLSNVTNMSGMFRECTNLNGPSNIGTWEISSVKDISNMFQSARIFNQNVGNWDTSNITNMGNLFSDCFLFNQNIENWNTSNVTNMSYMFYGTLSFNQNLSNWNTTSVTNMGFMFCYAQSFNQNLTNWNTENVTDMSSMFYAAISFNQNISSWKLSPIVDMNNMLLLSGINCINYSLSLIGWAANPDTPYGRNLDSVNILYGTNAKTARNYLTLTKGWTILDDMLNDTNCGLTQTITAADITKTYGDDPFVLNATTNSGLIIDYISTDSSTAEVFQDSINSNTWKVKINKAGEVNIIAKQAGNEIYNKAADAIFKLTVKKATLNIVAEAKTKVYGTSDPALTYTVSGLANNDDQSIITGALTRTAGENIGIYEIQQGTLATTANYDLVFTAADFNITKATLNIVAEPKSKVYGTTDPVLTYTVTGLANNDDQSIITGALTRTAGENIGIYEIQQGTLATTTNYDLVFTTADFNITKATLNIVAEAKAKVYGTTDPVLTYTVTGLANNDDQSIITGALSRTTGENIGTYEIQQGTLATTANYELVFTTADFNITKATLNIVADAKAKVYGTIDPTLTYTVNGLANNDDQSIITGALSRTAGENIGTYEIQQGTLATTANYDLVFTTADFNITKATLNIVAEPKAKVYGTTDPALTYTVTGLANNDDQSIITGALTRTTGENIGTYEIQQGTLAAKANYDITYTKADFDITKATLNIVAEAKAKVYGTTDPVLTYTVTGLANNDDQSIITGALSRTAGENIGTYEIQQGTLATTANYDLVFTTADFNITKATLNIVAEAKAKVYGTADPVLTYTVTGLANNDDQSIITGALSRTAGENIGTYEIQQGTLATTANYDLVFTAADFNITKATLNIVAEPKSKVYGTTDPALTYTVTGLANNDDQSIITGALSRTTGENIRTYEIQQGTLATTANYDLVFTTADFNITKATLNIVAEPKAKVYGTTDPALTYTVTGLANNDDQSIITGALTRTTGENIGTYEIQQGTLATTANYDLVFTTADFNITKATLNIVADAKNKVYGTTDPVLTYTVTGFANGDNPSVITGNLSRDPGEDEGTYAIQQGTLNAYNYNMVYTGADFIIFKTFTIIVTDQTNVTCNGGADGSATVEVNGGIPQYTYSWAPYGGNQATANGLTAGTYTVTITDAIGLAITQEFIITEPPVVVPPTAQTLQTICASADLTLNDIQIQGTQIKWYATAQDTNELPETTALVNGTTYYASQTINGCESVGRTAVTVTLNTIDAPVVEPYSLCQSATVADLEIVTPTGVSYKWYTTETGGTELSEDTVLVTQTYYVEKTEGDCVSQRTAVQVTILEIPESPTGAANQSFTVNNIGEATIADLVMDQENIIWYISLEDAMSGNDPLAAEMPLENGQTYYAVLMNTNGCSSVPTAVTVDITLSTDEFDTSGLKYYPNPTSDILTVTYKNSIDRVTVYNLIGQRVITHEANSKEVQLNMSALANGNYMLEIRSGKQVKFVKVVKK